MLISEQQLIARASEILRTFGCEAAGLGPNGYQRREFGHVYGPSILIKPSAHDLTPDDLDRMSSEIIAKVSGICGLSVDRRVKN